MNWPDAATYITLGGGMIAAVVTLTKMFKPEDAGLAEIRETAAAHDSRIDALEAEINGHTASCVVLGQENKKDLQRIHDKIDNNHKELIGMLMSIMKNQ